MSEPTAGKRAKKGGVTIAEMVTLLSIPRRTLYDIFDRDKKKLTENKEIDKEIDKEEVLHIEISEFDKLVLKTMDISLENKMAQMTIEHNKRLASIMQAGKNNEGCL